MTTDLNPEGLERAAEALNEQGWTCDGGSHEPEGIDSCPACHEVCTDLARAAVTAYLDAQTVTTVEELGALPVGTVVFNQYGSAWQRGGRNWYLAGAPGGQKAVPYLPARVIHWGAP